MGKTHSLHTASALDVEQIERTLIGVMLIDQSTIDPVLRRVPPHAFRGQARSIYAAVAYLRAAGRIVDPQTVRNAMQAAGTFDAWTGEEVLACLESVGSTGTCRVADLASLFVTMSVIGRDRCPSVIAPVREAPSGGE